MNLIHRLIVGLLASLAISASAATAQDRVKSKDIGDSRTFKASDGKALDYRWLPPIEATVGTKYPLVVCLHGIGGGTIAPGRLAQKSVHEKYPCFIMIPSAGEGNCWATNELFGKKLARPESLPRMIEAIKALIHQEPIDPSRIYITGQSMGGVGTWAAIARNPELFAAAVPVCGAWDVKDAEKMVSVPIWAFHGEVDERVPVTFSRDLTAAVNKSGGTAKYKEYPGVGHSSFGHAYDEPGLWEWMFQQKK